jgi:hypothetical protein
MLSRRFIWEPDDLEIELTKYSDTQERDATGRWTDDGETIVLSDVDSKQETISGEQAGLDLFEGLNTDKWYGPGGSAGADLKASNVERIADQLAILATTTTNLDLADQLTEMGEHWSARGQELEHLARVTFLTEDQLDHMTMLERGAAFIASSAQNSWASSASDSEVLSIALQLAIADKFGLDPNASGMMDSMGVGGNTTFIPQAFGVADDPLVNAAREETHREYGADWQEYSNASEEDLIEIAGADASRAIASSPAMKAYVDTVYANTQAVLAEKGIEAVELYRGMSWEDDTPIADLPQEFSSVLQPQSWPGSVVAPGTPGFETLGEDPQMASEREQWERESSTQHMRVNMNPVSSFAADPGAAMEFTSRGPGILLSGTVPADRIFSFPGTGPGCLNEVEVLVIGGAAQRFKVENAAYV